MVTGRRVAALVVLVLGVGCGSTTPSGGNKPISSGDEPSGTTIGTDIKTLDSSPTPTPTTAATGTGGDQKPKIIFGTTRLDGEPGTSPWANNPPEFLLYLDDDAYYDCKGYWWPDETSVPITVVDVAFSNDLVRHGSFENDTSCGGATTSCRGFTFPPPNTGDRADKVPCGVPITAQQPPGGRAQTTLTLTMKTTCTSATAKPCDDPRVAAAGPSASEPVVLEWRHTETVTIRQLDSCRSQPCPTMSSSPAPMSSSPAPMSSSPAPMSSSPAPMSSSPVPTASSSR